MTNKALTTAQADRFTAEITQAERLAEMSDGGDPTRAEAQAQGILEYVSKSADLARRYAAGGHLTAGQLDAMIERIARITASAREKLAHASQ